MMNISVLQNVFRADHYTTINAINFYKKYMQPDNSVYDVGTGSGIIALTCKQLGAGTVVASDIDPDAIRCTRANAKRNNIDIDIRECYLNFGIIDKFDIIIANLYANAAADYIQYASENMTDDTILILTWFSGLPIDPVIKRFKIVEQTQNLEYNTYVLKRRI